MTRDLTQWAAVALPPAVIVWWAAQFAVDAAVDRWLRRRERGGS